MGNVGIVNVKMFSCCIQVFNKFSNYLCKHNRDYYDFQLQHILM